MTKNNPIKDLRYIGTPEKPVPSVESLGLPDNPLGYSLLLMQTESGAHFTLAGDAQFHQRLQAGMPGMQAAVDANARRHYYSRQGWPEEFESPRDASAWSPMGEN